MNIIEAIRSGRPFKRKHWKQCMPPFKRTEGFNPVTFELDAILADDWEIEEPSVTITASQFWDAVRGAANDDGVLVGRVMDLTYNGVCHLARRLGLEPKP